MRRKEDLAHAAEQTRQREESQSADRESYAAHVLHAQRQGDVEKPGCEIAFGMDADGALYSFASDGSGMTVRVSEPGSAEVKSIWVPSDLFGALRRSLVASQEKSS